MAERVSRPTAESISAQCTLAWLDGELLSQAEIAGIMWATYLVDALRRCRTYAELQFLYKTGLLHGTLSIQSKITGTTALAEHGMADERLSNSVWGNGNQFFQFALGKLPMKLHDGRFTADFEEIGYVALFYEELPEAVASKLARLGRASVTNPIDSIVDMITRYKKEAMWL